MIRYQTEHRICKLCDSELTIENKKYNLVKCSECKLVFARPIYSEEQLGLVYRSLYSEGGGYTRHLQELKDLRKGHTVNIGYNKKYILQQLLNQNIKNVVELGAGVGIVANYLKDKIYYLGYEYDKDIAAQACQLKFNIQQGDHYSLRGFDKNKVDAIVAFEVLEHIPDVKECLQSIYISLRSNGLLGFTVPNYDRRLNNKEKLRYEWIGQDSPPVHVNFWNLDSMHNTLQIAGFEIVEVKVRRLPYLNWPSFANTLRQYVQLAKGNYYGPTLLGIARKP